MEFATIDRWSGAKVPVLSQGLRRIALGLPEAPLRGLYRSLNE